MSFYDFKMKTIDGKDYDFAQLKGKKVMIVNTASKCGLTPQYASLEELNKEFGGDKFVILGFPANNFMSQEPENNSTIAEFCQKNYGVSFQMFEKISVKGADKASLFDWLTHKDKNGVADAKVEWNFHKFLIDENGKDYAIFTGDTDHGGRDRVHHVDHCLRIGVEQSRIAIGRDAAALAAARMGCS